MGRKRRPTEEEYREKKPKILDLSRKGYPMRRIEDMLDITEYYLKQIREELINEGSISREEIKIAYDRYMIENPPSQGLNKSRARKRPNTEKSDKVHQRNIERKETTYELVKQGMTVAEMANETQLSEKTIMGYMRELVEEGRITPEEGSRNSDGKTQVRINRHDPEYILKIKEVSELLRQGWKTAAIKKRLNITSFYINIYLKDIRAKKIVTPEEIEEARQQKRERDLNELEGIIKSGRPVDSIKKTHPEFTQNETVALVKELIEAGKVTREEVNKNGRRAANERKSRTKGLSYNEQIAFMVDKIRKGYSPQEILESDETKTLTIHKIRYLINHIIEKGIISAKEVKALQKKHQAEKLAERDAILIDKIKEYTTQGYTFKEIADLLGYEYTYLLKIKYDYIRDNGWFDNEELKEFRKQRKLRDYEALLQEEKDRLEQQKKEKQKAIEIEKEKEREIIAEREKSKKEKIRAERQEKLELIKQYFLEGKTVIEIAEILGIRREQVYNLQNEAKRRGTWFSDEELEEAKQRRLNRKEEEKQKRHQIKDETIKREKQERKEEEEKRKKQELRNLINLATQGLNNEEMSNQMHYSVEKIIALKRIAAEQGIWFSEEELEFYKKQREKREAQEERERQKREQEILKLERKKAEREKREEEEAKKKEESEKRKKIKSLESEYKRLRKAAKNEDKLEWDGEENVSFSGRQKFTELLIKLDQMGAMISSKDIEIVFNAIYMHTDFVKPQYLKFLIVNASKHGGIENAEKTAISLRTELRNTKYYEPLYEYTNYLKRQKLHIQIKRLKGQGLTNSQIAERLHIRSAEVVVLSEESKEKPKLLEDESK